MVSSPSPPDEQAVRQHLDRLLQSNLFSSSQRLTDFLRFVVDAALTGRADELKEYLIAVEVYGRKPDYDPQVKSTVRVEASRLRNRLREYYESEGATEPVRIELPKGRYAPVFRWAETIAPTPEAAPPPRRQSSLTRHAGALLLIPAALAGWWWAGRGNAPAVSAIAVLPFVNLGVEADERFCDGITEGITAALATNADLRVPSRTALVHLKNKPVDMRKLADDLDVDAFLEGSVRREGARYLITTQLIRARDGRRLFVETYDRSSHSPLDLQQRIASEVSAGLSDRLAGRARWRTSGNPPASSKTMEAYLRANDLLGQDPRVTGWPAGIPPHFQEALTLLESATNAEPRFAAAWSSLAHGLLMASEFDKTNRENLLGRARAAAKRTIDIDSTSAEAYMIIGDLALYKDWDFRTAETALRRAVELNPRDASSQREYADLLRITGRHDLARLELNRALLLTPNSAGLRAQNALHLYDEGRCDDAIREADQALVLRPKFSQALWLKGLCHEADGNYPDAERQFGLALEVVKQDGRALPALGHLYGITGKRTEAEQIIKELEQLRAAGKDAAYSIALVYAGLGRRDQALQALETGLRERDSNMPYITVEKRFIGLRTDKRFGAIAAKVGLSPD